MTNLTQINAPYNFVPVSNKVVLPDWGKSVSQDVPFKDGISGEIELDIEALSPILVGGKQKPADSNNPGEVHFYQTPNGQYAIPGSSLRGVIRSVLEIATFSRMSQIDDKRYAMRDISGKYVSESYTERVRNNVCYGFLQLNKEGKPSITPCDMARLDHRDLERWWRITQKPIFKARSSVASKYEHWEALCKTQKTNPLSLRFSIEEGKVSKKVSEIERGSLTGYPVFTGQINAEDPNKSDFGKKRKGRPKYQDFMFYNERENELLLIDEVDPSAWRNFLFVHNDDGGKPEESWTGYWKNKFWNQQKVPVFYVKSKSRLSIGLAYMPKLAGDFSTHDMLKHTSDDHLPDASASPVLDFASLIFGQVGEKPEDALKGRVSFDLAPLVNEPSINNHPSPTILNGAKPSYFPNYVYQETNQTGDRLKGDQYATYVYSPSSPAPELRGWKRYPARADSEVRQQRLGKDQESNKKVQTKLFPLSKGAQFKGRLVFHNLKPEELGALLWCLELENNRHSIGMAKSFGYGQVRIDTHWEPNTAYCNDPNKPLLTPESYIKAFQDYMDEALGECWRESTAVQALCAMANISPSRGYTGNLEHMKMGMGTKSNEFLQAKQSALVLQSFVTDRRTLKKVSHVNCALEAPVAEVVYEEMTGYLKRNTRNQSLYLESSGKSIAFASGSQVEKIESQLSDAEKKPWKQGKGIRVTAKVHKQEIYNVKIRNK